VNISRQIKWQQEKKKQGLCTICGKPQAKNSKALCDLHLKKCRDRYTTRKDNEKNG